MTNKLVTPFGKIEFMQIAKPFIATELRGQEGIVGDYIIRLIFNEADKGVAEFLEVLEANTPNKISRRSGGQDLPAGQFGVRFKTKAESAAGKHIVKILDGTGVDWEGEIPHFDSRVDTGLAAVRAILSTKGMQPTYYLNGVMLKDLVLTDKTTLEGSSEDAYAELRALAGE
jgi:hypothetical protein